MTTGKDRNAMLRATVTMSEDDWHLLMKVMICQSEIMGTAEADRVAMKIVRAVTTDAEVVR